MLGIRYVNGPYLIDKDKAKPRYIVNLIMEDGTRKTTSYARYLLQMHLGVWLNSDLEVDHIDENPLNDNISNLRAISGDLNRRRSAPAPELYHFICPVCNNPSTRLARKVRDKHKQGSSGPFCGKSCAGRWSSTHGRSSTAEQDIRDNVIKLCPYGHIKDGIRTESNGKKYTYCKECARQRAPKYKKSKTQTREET